MKGIDISAWQDCIDWEAVKAAGIEFVIIKLGQNNVLDEMFVEHVNNAVAYGLRYGVYVYSRAISNAEAQTEADFVAEQINTLLAGKTPEMGIWFDMEDARIEAEGVYITGICNAFIDRIKELGHDYVGVYSSYNWFTNGNVDPDQLTQGTPLWVAQYNYECNLQHPNLRIWQYTDSMNIAGTNFDANEYYE